MNTKRIESEKLVKLLNRATYRVLQKLVNEGYELETNDVLKALGASFSVLVLSHDYIISDPVAVLRLICGNITKNAEDFYKILKGDSNHEEDTV